MVNKLYKWIAMKLNTLFSKFSDVLFTIFLTGLFTILPLAITVFVFVFTFRMVRSWLEPIACYTPTCFAVIPYFEFLLVLGAIFLIGIVVRTLFVRTLVHAAEKMIAKIPLVRFIYGGIKQLVNALSSQEKDSFQQVVLVEFPRQGMYSIGFLTGKSHPFFSPDATHEYHNIFLPTTPNPTTGFFIIVAPSDYKVLPLTRHEAMSLIISGGIIQPETQNN